MNLNKFGKRAYNSALKRGKIRENFTVETLHAETIEGLSEEVKEVIEASESETSEHLNGYTALTELHRRGVDIEALLHEKMKYNEQR